VLNAQSLDADVKRYIAKLEQGQTEEVKKILPDLAAKYPNNPAVLYLQGRLSTNGNEAVKFYQTIIDNFPKNEWADDALFSSYQYYTATGLYKTADLKFQQLKKEYPNSPFIAGKSATSMPQQDEPVAKISPPDIAAASPETTKQSEPPQQIETPEPYTLQVGAYSTVANAEKQRVFFENLGVNVEITNKVRGGRSLYLVWAGSFKSADEAKEFGKEIKKKHKIDSIVVEKY
jgi:cell division septation protein DedD